MSAETITISLIFFLVYIVCCWGVERFITEMINKDQRYVPDYKPIPVKYRWVILLGPVGIVVIFLFCCAVLLGAFILWLFGFEERSKNDDE